MTPIRSLLVATDFSEAARHAVDRVALLSAQLEATATLLHVDNSSRAPEPQRRFAPLRRTSASSSHGMVDVIARELRTAHRIDVQAETRRGDVCDQILLMSGGADLVALASKRRNPLHRWIFGSTPGRLLGRCRRPMLVVKQAPKGPYRRVLVLTDFSAESAAAAELAACIAPAAELHLFHAIGLRDETEMRFAEVPESVIRNQRMKRKATAQIRMERTMETINPRSNRFVHAFRHGSAVPLALLKQRAIDADLLVVARRARLIASSFPFWSVARRLSDGCACDVLVVPAMDSSQTVSVLPQLASNSCAKKQSMRSSEPCEALTRLLGE